MAKWGEGDPRWIVEERADAKNVNNWHWIEKNAKQWSIDKIKSLFTGFTIDTGKCKTYRRTYSVDFIEIEKVTKCDGDAYANNRKGKVIIIYDLEIEFDWKGKVIFCTTSDSHNIYFKVTKRVKGLLIKYVVP